MRLLCSGWRYCFYWAHTKTTQPYKWNRIIWYGVNEVCDLKHLVRSLLSKYVEVDGIHRTSFAQFSAMFSRCTYFLAFCSGSMCSEFFFKLCYRTQNLGCISHRCFRSSSDSCVWVNGQNRAIKSWYEFKLNKTTSKRHKHWTTRRKRRTRDIGDLAQHDERSMQMLEAQL